MIAVIAVPGSCRVIIENEIPPCPVLVLFLQVIFAPYL